MSTSTPSSSRRGGTLGRWGAASLAGYQAVRLLVAIAQLVVSGAVGIALAWVLQLPLALVILLGLVVAITLGLWFGIYDEWRTRSAEPPPGRVGIRNTGGGRSASHGATFGSGLDTAIENRDGGQSEDHDSTFE